MLSYNRVKLSGCVVSVLERNHNKVSESILVAVLFSNMYELISFYWHRIYDGLMRRCVLALNLALVTLGPMLVIYLCISGR